jgi:DNA polymerase-1
MSEKYDVLILDGRHLLWRSSDAFGTLSIKQGAREVATGGIYGFLSVAARVHERYGGRLVVAWEGDRSKNFRRALFKDYKKKPPMDAEMSRLHDEMEAAERRLKILLKLLRVDQYEGDCCEADDVIGTVTARAYPLVNRIAIYSGDSDLRQLVSEMDTEVHVIAPLPRGKGDVVYDAEEVQKKHEVMPSLIAQLKALAGDPGDGIPGARGIGPKTAAILLNHYGSLDDVLRASQGLPGQIRGAGWPCTERQKTLVANAAKDVKLYLKLTTIDRNAKLIAIKPKKGPPDQKVVLEALQKLKFRSLAAPAELRTLMRLSGKD